MQIVPSLLQQEFWRFSFLFLLLELDLTPDHPHYPRIMVLQREIPCRARVV